MYFDAEKKSFLENANLLEMFPHLKSVEEVNYDNNLLESARDANKEELKFLINHTIEKGGDQLYFYINSLLVLAHCNKFIQLGFSLQKKNTITLHGISWVFNEKGRENQIFTLIEKLIFIYNYNSDFFDKEMKLFNEYIKNQSREKQDVDLEFYINKLKETIEGNLKKIMGDVKFNEYMKEKLLDSNVDINEKRNILKSYLGCEFADMKNEILKSGQVNSAFERLHNFLSKDEIQTHDLGIRLLKSQNVREDPLNIQLSRKDLQMINQLSFTIFMEKLKKSWSQKKQQIIKIFEDSDDSFKAIFEEISQEVFLI